MQAALEELEGRFARAGIDSPRADAEWLLAHVLDLPRSRLVLERRRPLSPQEARRLEALACRREAREPLQLLLGSAEFYGLSLEVRPGVLVPRPETERLVELALARLPRGARVADVGTGSGAVALALKAERPDLRVSATDLDAAALDLASANARRLHLEVQFLHGDLLAGIAGPLEAVVSNPPYLPASDRSGRPPELGHEPDRALYSGSDGLELSRRLLTEARAALVPGGFVALELDPRNVRALEAEAARSDWETRVEADLTGQERFLIARIPSASAP
nr:peptide chain release factor N(5)-glutamine methyltransferase [Deinobacterium chartae]